MLKPKLDVMVQHGLQVAVSHEASREVYDFELARNTCTMLSKLATKRTEAGKYVKPLRFPNNHSMFVKITELLTAGLCWKLLPNCEYPSYKSSAFTLKLFAKTEPCSISVLKVFDE